jgi:hypothetical protein
MVDDRKADMLEALRESGAGHSSGIGNEVDGIVIVCEPIDGLSRPWDGLHTDMENAIDIEEHGAQ